MLLVEVLLCKSRRRKDKGKTPTLPIINTYFVFPFSHLHESTLLSMYLLHSILYILKGTFIFLFGMNTYSLSVHLYVSQSSFSTVPETVLDLYFFFSHPQKFCSFSFGLVKIVFSGSTAFILNLSSALFTLQEYKCFCPFTSPELQLCQLKNGLKRKPSL